MSDSSTFPDGDQAPSDEGLQNLPEFSVSEISQAVKRTLEQRFDRVRVRGEISGFKRAASGHLYMALKDEKAVLDAVCWRGLAGRLAINPEDGMEVIATGRVTSYPGRSKYQIVIESLELAGEGALLKLLEDRRRKLAAEGLFEEARKQPLPFLPEVIGVVTSPTGAVIRDILHRLRDRFPRRVLVWPAGAIPGPTRRAASSPASKKPKAPARRLRSSTPAPRRGPGVKSWPTAAASWRLPPSAPPSPRPGGRLMPPSTASIGPKAFAAATLAGGRWTTRAPSTAAGSASRVEHPKIQVQFRPQPDGAVAVVLQVRTGLRVDEDHQIAAVQRQPGHQAAEEFRLEGHLIAPTGVRPDQEVAPAPHTHGKFALYGLAKPRSRLLALGIVIDMGVIAMDLRDGAKTHG